jgi:hypothetical protein
MNQRSVLAAVGLSLSLLVTGCADQKSGAGDSGSAAMKDDYRRDFNVPKENFRSVGRNDYFVLEPGFQSVLTGTEDGNPAKLIVSVLDQTQTIDGVETRVVEERESQNGELVEVSRNFFAIDDATKDVYYFGEDVDTYKHGKVTGHEGSWQSGKEGAHYGLFMPAKAQVGERFYQEIAPKKAMDRCEITSVTEKVTVPAGTFEHCVKTRETTPLEPETRESKVYAPQAGLLIDGGLKLEKYGAAAK